MSAQDAKPTRGYLSDPGEAMKCDNCHKREGKYLIDYGNGITAWQCFGCSLNFEYNTERLYLAGVRRKQRPRRREAIEHTRRKLGL